jgi:hypothetical protein
MITILSAEVCLDRESRPGEALTVAARAESGQATALLPRSVMNSRRSLDYLVGAG